MAKKVTALLLASVIICISLGAIPSSSMGSKHLQFSVSGTVHNSSDGAAEIYDDTGNWACKNITVYSLDGAKPPVANDGTADEGANYPGYDTFRFDAGWRAEDNGREGIVVGESKINNVTYVFLTSFEYNYWGWPPEDAGEGVCDRTEWEPIPKPYSYIKASGSKDLIIPNFSNPVLQSLGITTLPNVENTVGFSVYRDNICIGGATRRGFGNVYFYTDPVGENYDDRNYSAKPIVKGGFYGDTPEPIITIATPYQSLTGRENYTVQYGISGGVVPYKVNVSFVKGAYYEIITDTELNSDNSSLYYNWKLPSENTDIAVIQINVTDGLDRPFVEQSHFFTIDSEDPKISYVSPEPNATDIDLYDDIIIKFNEAMNMSSVENALSLPDIAILMKEWSEDNSKLRIKHGGFEQNKTYFCSLSTLAKDSSLPGNNLKSTYSWSFRTTPNITASIIYPRGGECYTGNNTTLEIKYLVARGIAPYNITIEFFDGSTWTTIYTTKQNFDTEWTYNWTLPKLDALEAKLRLKVRDNATPRANTREKLVTFAIDSTPPTVISYTGKEELILTTEELWVSFSEAMDNASVEQGFKLTKSATGEVIEVNYRWLNDTTVIITPKATLIPDTNYTAQINITAKDLSLPGNYLKEPFSWEFVAALGQADFIVSIIYNVPPAPKVGDKAELSVYISNTGSRAFNQSGEVRVWFYEIKEGGKREALKDETLGRILQGANKTASIEIVFKEARNYNFLVVVDSTNPKDIFNNKDFEWSGFSTTVAEQPPIRIVPYALIALMVILVIAIGCWIVISKKRLKKK